jgi:hypothetical protein
MRKTLFINLTAVVALACGTVVCAQETAPPPPQRQGEKRFAPADESQLNQAWSGMPLRDKASALRLYNALRQMPPEERKFVHERIERFMQMSPDERRKLKENNELWQKMTPEERQQAREKFTQRRKEFEEKWRKEHPGQQPPPFPYHHRKGDGGTNATARLSEPKNNPPNP